MDDIQLINDSPYKAFFAIAGGGQTFLGEYCLHSGASKTVVGALIPYDRVIFNNFIGGKIDSYASPEAARKLAISSYGECLKAGVQKEFAIGIGASSSIATDNERAGKKHKFNVAAHTYDSTYSIAVIVNQGASREEEESMIKDLIFEFLWEIATQGAKFENLKEFAANAHSDAGESTTFHAVENSHFSKVASKEIPFVSSIPLYQDLAIFGGSFNPIHEGHKQIKELAEKTLNKKVFLELSVKNTDKGSLDFIEIQKRIDGLVGYDYIIDMASTYVEKTNAIKSYDAKISPIFIVGADTWNRIWDEKYGYPVKYLESFFDEYGVKFLVFGRNERLVDKGGVFRIVHPDAENFNVPISSTQIRNQK